MLKEVDASGKISLGENYAGRLFDVIIHPDDRFELIFVRVVATAQPAGPAGPAGPQMVAAPDKWVAPGGDDQCTKWALDKRVALALRAAELATGNSGAATRAVSGRAARNVER